MKYVNNVGIVASFLSTVLFIGCSTPPKRSVWTDKSMRVCLSPDGITTQDAVAITTALVKTGKFMIIDRSLGFRSVKAEQDRVHRVEADRYSDREKYSMFGKLYGCGSVAVGHSQCYRKKPFFTFSNQPYVNVCQQYISLVDSNSAEVIVAVDGSSESPIPAANFGSESFIAPSNWDQVVTDLVEAYPRDYKPQFYSEGMNQYRAQAEEEAVGQKELVQQQRKPASSENTYIYNPQSDLMMMKRATQPQGQEQ